MFPSGPHAQGLGHQPIVLSGDSRTCKRWDLVVGGGARMRGVCPWNPGPFFFIS